MIKPKPEIMNTPSAHHGAFDYDELGQLGYSPDEVIDFSVNSNPYGPPPGVREAIANVPLDRYPDRECLTLREKLAKKHNVNIENIVVGNGTAELMMLIAMAFIRQGDKILQIAPAFTEYGRVAKLMGADIIKVQTKPDEEFEIDLDRLENQIREHQPSTLFFSNPNNPTGTPYFSRLILSMAQQFPDTLFISDEAYMWFIKTHALGVELYRFISGTQDERLTVVDIQPVDNIISLRSLTKDYAIAGLRLGYAIGHPDIIEAIRLVRPAWNVNALAQVAGLAVLDQTEWLRQTVHQLHENKAALVNGLYDLGLKALPSAVHYFLVNVGNAKEFRSKLLRHKIMVRDCTSFGLPEYVRISTRKPDDNQKLLAAIKAIQNDR